LEPITGYKRAPREVNTVEMMDFLIRFSQSHETFRLPEIQALALIEGIDMKAISYSLDVSQHHRRANILTP
jgi:hypothetical protein